MKMHPDIVAMVRLASTAEAMTGDGLFADTDLVRIPYNGWLLINVTCSANAQANPSQVAVPQINHVENNFSFVNVLEAGVAPDFLALPNYKIWIEKGMTPRILYDEDTNGVAFATGAFFRGRNNPVGLNTPDILVYKSIAATAQNVLVNTDLEDCPFPGWLLVWASSNAADDTLQIGQAGHQTGMTNSIPTFAGGLAVDISHTPAHKMYVPATGNPTVTVNVASGTEVLICAAFYIDWQNVNQSMIRRMGL